MSKKDLLLTVLRESVDKCYQNDLSLIDRGMEQASVARIFFYMQEALQYDNRFESLKHYNLDSEYNKNKKRVKETPRCKHGTRPDIILHTRLENSHNLLIVEFKAQNASFRRDKYR